jgi:8-oxo-dGTP pyrophosphatase MutT (NUDIX family)
MPDSLIATDARFCALSEALASYAGGEGDPPIHERDRFQAAVSLVIRGRDELDFLLIKRARSERDPWSGHMALPGGRRDDSDGNLRHTARRETLEETGVDLERVGATLGRLDDVVPRSGLLPKLTIASFVFGVPADTEAWVASAEIEKIFWVGLDDLRRPDNHGTVEIALPGGSRDFPCYDLVGEHVWGLTHSILQHFLELYPESDL